MMNDLEKINDFRNQALYYSKSGKRFKILIETVTGCFGSCLGCAFTADERSNFTPKISSENLPKMFKKLEELLDYTSPKSIVSPYETTVINYGGSEHFIYDNEYLGKLFEETSIFWNNVKTTRNVLAFSSSGLLNIDKMEKRSENMIQHLDKDQFVVDFVIDLARFEKLKDRYQNSLDFFKNRFGFVDLAINLESFSDMRDWEAFCHFVDQNGILNVDLIYSINKNNKQRVSLASEKIFNIYEKIVLGTKQGKSLFDLHGLLRIQLDEVSKTEELNNMNMQDVCRKAAKNILHDAIFVNSDFQVYPVLFVLFADVPLAERLDIKPIGNLFDEDFKEKFIAYEDYLYSLLLKTFIKSKQCSDCSLVKNCYQTGAPLLNKYLNYFNNELVETFDQCQNPVKSFLLAKEKNYLILKEDEVN